MKRSEALLYIVAFSILAMGLVWLNNLNYMYSRKVTRLKDERDVWISRYHRIQAEYYRKFPFKEYVNHVEAEGGPGGRDSVVSSGGGPPGKDSDNRN